MATMNNGHEAPWTAEIRRIRPNLVVLLRPCPRQPMRTSSGVRLCIHSSPLSLLCHHPRSRLADRPSLLTPRFLRSHIPMMVGETRDLSPSTRSIRVRPGLLIRSTATASNRLRPLYLFLHMAPTLGPPRRKVRRAAITFRLLGRARALAVADHLFGQPFHPLLPRQHPDTNIQHLLPLEGCIMSPRQRPRDQTPFAEQAKNRSPLFPLTPPLKAPLQCLQYLILISPLPTRERILLLPLIIIRQMTTVDGPPLLLP
jgi:hypothetical protein